MRLLLCGAHGTGKSTALLGAQKTLESLGFEIFDSVSAKFFKPEDFKDPQKMLAKQLAFTQFQCDLFSEDKIASSRSYADIWAYSKHLFERDENPVYRESMDLIMQKAIDAHKSNPLETKYIYFPIAFNLKEVQGKDLRSTNLDFQKEIDANIIEFFKLTGIPFFEMQETSIPSRIKKLEQYATS